MFGAFTAPALSPVAWDPATVDVMTVVFAATVVPGIIDSALVEAARIVLVPETSGATVVAAAVEGSMVVPGMTLVIVTT